MLGYWVVSAYRRQGYGKAIIQALEERVVRRYPFIEASKAYIHERNVGSAALASYMGYEEDHEMSSGQVGVFRKRLI